jgi:integrase
MRRINRLTARFVDTVARPGFYPDGGGLWLQVTSPTAKSWIFRYTRHGRTRDMGLGSKITVGLAEARGKALACRRQLLDNIDPIEAKRAERMQAKLASASAVTFKQATAGYIAAHRTGWRNGKHAAQWEATLATYAEPILGGLPVQAIDTGLVMEVLTPIWSTKPETGGRVRGRIEAVLDWAKARGYRNGDNPSRWRGHIDQLLPARSKVQAVEHHAALPYTELPAFMVDLRAQAGTAARCLEFVILTWARTGEAIGAQWTEFDLKEKTWIVPGCRMKAGRDHAVPLSDRVIEILADSPRTGAFVFEGARAGKPLSNTSMLMLMRRMGRGDLTTHGFRSTAKDWASETTSHPDIVSEMALAHTVPDKVQQAYRRGVLLGKRRRLMRDWARYCASPARGRR